MKIDMDCLGNLVITPESEIEAYGLKHWAEVNLSAIRLNLLIDCSRYPMMLSAHSTWAVAKSEATA
ncbi:conserved hypothetical protein [Burkholderia latens]|uniref:hypothetical protein n=1 Tax=Burkholderia latens TaxID=488446 RepID=UPI0039A718DE